MTHYFFKKYVGGRKRIPPIWSGNLESSDVFPLGKKSAKVVAFPLGKVTGEVIG